MAKNEFRRIALEQGVWCRQDNKFYYLDTGRHSMRMRVQKTINILISRGLLDIDPTERQIPGREPYKIMTRDQAEEKGYEQVTLYLSKTVKTQGEKDEKGKKLDIWS